MYNMINIINTAVLYMKLSEEWILGVLITRKNHFFLTFSFLLYLYEMMAVH